MDKIQKRLWTSDLCCIFGVTPYTIRKWTNRGILNCLKMMGGKRYFTRDMVLEFNKKHCLINPSIIDEYMKKNGSLNNIVTNDTTIKRKMPSDFIENHLLKEIKRLQNRVNDLEQKNSPSQKAEMSLKEREAYNMQFIKHAYCKAISMFREKNLNRIYTIYALKKVNDNSMTWPKFLRFLIERPSDKVLNNKIDRINHTCKYKVGKAAYNN